MHLITCLLSLILCTTFQEKPLNEDQKIEHLITYIQSMNNIVLIRNGSEHSSLEAAEHLRMKRAKAGKSVKTALDFIDKIASESSLTGKPYEIKFIKSGRSALLSSILKIELRKIENNN
jgi:hypothetical protein